MSESAAIAGMRAVLKEIGHDPDREGILGTPDRFLRYLREATEGESMSPEAILSTRFKADCDDIVICDRIDFVSTCEHHLLPFIGKASIGYIPGSDGLVVGLSKLPRLVQCFARRLQLQEILTKQIADSLFENLKPKGVAVVIEASHSCMTCRGVRCPEGRMITSSMLGVFRDSVAARTEFLQLIAR